MLIEGTLNFMPRRCSNHLANLALRQNPTALCTQDPLCDGELCCSLCFCVGLRSLQCLR